MRRVGTGRLSTWLLIACLSYSVDARADDRRALVTVAVNHVQKGDVLIVIRGTDVLVGVQSLEALGLHRFGGARDVINGTVFVSLTSLTPDITYEFDERAVELRLAADPRLLDPVVRSLATGRPPDIEFRRDTSAFANYAVNLRGSEYDLFSDLGFSTHGAFIGTTLSHASHQSVVRGLSSATFDQRVKMRRFIIGDTFANGGLIGGGTLVSGVTVSREYAVDPYFIRYPAFNLSGAVTTPSIAEVYVNDRLVRTEQLAPGQFALRELPVTNGRNDARVVLRDAFGGVRDLSASYYLTTSVLARGLQEYQYSLGYQRRDFGVANWSYGPLAFIARHRVGLSQRITLGGRLEARSELASGGPTLNVQLPAGEIEAAGALSRDGGSRGNAASVAYSYAGHAINMSVAVRTMSRQYTTSSLKADDDKQRIDGSALMSVRLGPLVSVTLQRRNAEMYVSGLSTRTSLIGSLRLNRRTDLSVTGSLDKSAAGPRREVFAGVSIRAGKALAMIAGEHLDGRNHLVTEVQQPTPIGTGWGYRFHGDSGEQSFNSGSIQYQGPHGRYEVRRDVTDGVGKTTLIASGSLVAMTGGVYAARPINDGFALVRVPDVPRVRAYLSNQEVGRTNGHGNVLVPNLLSYYGNVLNISDQDVPLDNSVGAVRKTIAPPYRGGALVVFPVQRVQSVQGIIELEVHGERITPSFGQLAVMTAGNKIESPVGERGEFYLENVPPGAHEALLQYGDRSCGLTLEVPVSDAPIVVIGMLRCVVP